MIHYTTENKSNDEDGRGNAFLREPGVVEAWQTAANVPIPSELRSRKRGE
jgi:hypothetical protein